MLQTNQPQSETLYAFSLPLDYKYITVNTIFEFRFSLVLPVVVRGARMDIGFIPYHVFS